MQRQSAPRRRSLRWGFVTAASVMSAALVALTATAIVGAVAAAPGAGPLGSSRAAEPAPSRGVGRDPLTPAELETARAAGRAGLSGSDVNGAPGPEYLSFELADARPGETSPRSPRRAAVYFYDYSTDALTKRVVNLAAGTVEATFTRKGIQPPPAAKERAKAVRLFLADELSSDFRARFARVTGAALRSADQLEITATSYIARPADTGAGQCGRHRCLQLSPRVPDGPFIDITDIVIDLSGRTVARLR